MRHAIARPTQIAISIAALVTFGCWGDVAWEPGTRAASIINGEPTPDDMYPTVGALGTLQGGVCTATIISPTAVLTAGHCVHPAILGSQLEEPPGGFDYFFTFSRNLRGTDPANLMEIESVEWYAGFPEQGGMEAIQPGPHRLNDIAVAHLANPVTGRPFQKLAEPDQAREFMAVDTEVEAIGYGVTVDGDVDTAGVLHHGVSRVDELGDHEVAVGDRDDQQACNGDSGGPILSRSDPQLQLGVASRMNPRTFPPACNSGVLYTRVDLYLDWIRERVPDLVEPVVPNEQDVVPADPGDPEEDAGPDLPDSDAGVNQEECDDYDDASCGCRASGYGAPADRLLFIGMMAFVFVLRRRRT